MFQQVPNSECVKVLMESSETCNSNRFYLYIKHQVGYVLTITTVDGLQPVSITDTTDISANTSIVKHASVQTRVS